MTPWTDDALFIGPLIVQRLKAELLALREVVLLDDLEDKQAGPRQCPAVVVLLDAMQPAGREGQPRMPADQVWLTMLALRSARPEPDRQRTAAGPLISQVVRALQGWQPPGATRVLSWVRGPRPSYGKDTSYFPLAWAIQVTST